MFEPPFCPEEACANHSQPPRRRWWRHDGHHRTDRFGPVQRFRCLGCGRSFSIQTFSLDYRARRAGPA